MKKVLMSIILIGVSASAGYLFGYNLKEETICAPCTNEYEQQRLQNLDILNFEIKRADMLELYTNKRGFEKLYTFWDTVKFVRVEQQF